MTRYMLKNDPKTMEQIRVLISEGLRVPQIAQKINLSMTTIRKFIKENNIEYITRRCVYIKHDWDSISLDYKAGVQVDDICEKHGVGEQYLSWAMKDRGVTRPEWYKRKQINPLRKDQIIVDKIKFLAKENLTIAGIARVIKFTLTQDQLPDYPLDYAAIENICDKHKITTKG